MRCPKHKVSGSWRSLHGGGVPALKVRTQASEDLIEGPHLPLGLLLAREGGEAPPKNGAGGHTLRGSRELQAVCAFVFEGALCSFREMSSDLVKWLTSTLEFTG